MSFQLRSGSDIGKCLKLDRFQEYVVCLYVQGEVLMNSSLTVCDDEVINQYLEENGEMLMETGDTFTEVFGGTSDSNNIVLLMSPLILHYNDQKTHICPVYMYLSETGLGMVKIRVPLIDLSADPFMAMPLLKWYEYASLYINAEKELFFKTDDKSVNDIADLLCSIIQETFRGFLLSGKKRITFESVLLSRTENPSIQSLTDDFNDYKELYHLCYPEYFLEEPSVKKLDDFAINNIIDIGGFKFFRCMPGRLVLFGDVDKLKGQFNRGEEIDDLEYLENSIQLTYDLMLCIAIWKRINHMSFLDVTKNNLLEFNSHKALYNIVENELDSMLECNSISAFRFYRLIYDNLDEVMNSYSDRLERVAQNEQIIKDKYNERKNLLFHVAALIGTLFFGLPAIRETLYILRTTLWKSTEEVSQRISIDGFAIAIWIGIIVVLGILLFHNYRIYKSYRLF